MLRWTLRVLKWTCNNICLSGAREQLTIFKNSDASDNTGFTQSWKNSKIVKTLFGLFIFSFHMVHSNICEEPWGQNCGNIDDGNACWGRNVLTTRRSWWRFSIKAPTLQRRHQRNSVTTHCHRLYVANIKISLLIVSYGTKLFKQPVLTEWRFERSKYSDAFIFCALNLFLNYKKFGNSKIVIFVIEPACDHRLMFSLICMIFAWYCMIFFLPDFILMKLSLLTRFRLALKAFKNLFIFKLRKVKISPVLRSRNIVIKSMHDHKVLEALI